MYEAELPRVQGEPADRILAARSVHRVAHDRMSRFGKVDPDLISAAGLERDLQHGVARTCCQRAVVRDRLLALSRIRRAFHAKGTILSQVRPEGARWLGELAVDDRDVNALDVMRREKRLESR